MYHNSSHLSPGTEVVERGVAFVQPPSEVGQVGGEKQERKSHGGLERWLTPFAACYFVCFLLFAFF